MNLFRRPRLDVAWNRRAWARYGWERGGDEWSDAFGGTEALWRGVIRPRIADALPTGHVLEIGAGHGRCTRFLLEACLRLSAVDLAEVCVAALRRRFRDQPHVRCIVNDGRSLDAIEDGSVDFVFSWDSLVHVDPGTIDAYVRQLARKLAPRGRGFLHHSNLGMHVQAARRLHPWEHLHGRHPAMSAAAFRSACRAAGLGCVRQELIPWSGQPGLWTDTFSWIAREHAGGETAVVQNAEWPAEVTAAKASG